VSREELPKALATWYDYTKWVLDRVDGFPKNQRFVLGTRLADAVLEVMETLAEAAYSRGVAMSAPPVQPGSAMRQKLPVRTAAFIRRPQPCRVQGPPGSPVRGEGREAATRTKQTRSAAASRK